MTERRARLPVLKLSFSDMEPKPRFPPINPLINQSNHVCVSAKWYALSRTTRQVSHPQGRAICFGDRVDTHASALLLIDIQAVRQQRKVDNLRLPQNHVTREISEPRLRNRSYSGAVYLESNRAQFDASLLNRTTGFPALSTFNVAEPS